MNLMKTPTDFFTHKPLQPLAPSLSYPAAQLPQDMDPTVFVHVRLLWQPPLLFRHSFTSECTVLCEWLCVFNGRLYSIRPTGDKLMLFTLQRVNILSFRVRSHTPIYRFEDARAHIYNNAHAYTHKPLQPLAPSLAYPAGQSPQDIDPTVFVHVRLLWQPPLVFRHSLISRRTVLSCF